METVKGIFVVKEYAIPFEDPLPLNYSMSDLTSWTEHHDDASGHKYWHNESTGETVFGKTPTMSGTNM